MYCLCDGLIMKCWNDKFYGMKIVIRWWVYVVELMQVLMIFGIWIWYALVVKLGSDLNGINMTWNEYEMACFGCYKTYWYDAILVAMNTWD